MGMIFIWTTDILRGKFKDQGNFFRWKEGVNMLWPHILAEFFTGTGLIFSAIGLYFKITWSIPFSMIFLGAMTYSSLNSLGWVVADKSRFRYGIPMIVGLIGGIVSILLLLFC